MAATEPIDLNALHGFLDDAKPLVREAGRIALTRLGTFTVAQKADKSVVTEVDHAIQAVFLDMLADRYPDHAVIAEESIPSPEKHAAYADARYCWVIDPLDGTRNYVAGIPVFGTSVAIMDRGIPVVGIVYEHHMDEMYTAIVGRGAFLGKERIQAGPTRTGGDRLIGIPSSKMPLAVEVLKDWVARPGLVMRNLGSTALHLALVAAGALDAAYSVKGKVWDNAAGAVLIWEAGGRICAPDGSKCFPFPVDRDPLLPMPVLASYDPLHEELLNSIAKLTDGV